MLAVALVEAIARTIFFGRSSLLGIDTGLRLLGLSVVVGLIVSSNKRFHSISAIACMVLLFGFILKFSSQFAQ